MTTRLVLFIFLLGYTFSASAQNPNLSPSPEAVQKPVFNSQPTQPAPPDITNSPKITNSLAPISAPSLKAELKNTGSFKRDPFRLPKYLIDKLTYKPAPVVVVDDQAIDDRAEPIKRWPAREYLLVGIIWEVKNPKGLVKDLQGRVHVVKLRDRLGNKEGIVTSIKEGAITVTEKKVPFVLRLKK